MAVFTLDAGWYFDRFGYLRRCHVVHGMGDMLIVVDHETQEQVDVRPEDVMTEPPDDE